MILDLLDEIELTTVAATAADSDCVWLTIAVIAAEHLGACATIGYKVSREDAGGLRDHCASYTGEGDGAGGGVGTARAIDSPDPMP